MNINKTIEYKLPNLKGAKLYGSKARIVEVEGREGINIPEIRGRLALNNHTLNNNSGSLTIWVCALQDLQGTFELPQHALSNHLYGNYTILSDREAVREIEQSNFALCYMSAGFPKTLWAKFINGSSIKVFDMEKPGAIIRANEADLSEFKWYQIGLSWNRSESQYKMYLNGVLVATGDTFSKKLFSDPCGPILYLGNPALVYSDISFYNEELNNDHFSFIFEKEAIRIDDDLQKDIISTHVGNNLPTFNFIPDDQWETQLKLPLNTEEDFQEFFIQGYGNGVTITDEGFHIKTPTMEEANSTTGIGKIATDNPGQSVQDLTRMYLWTRKMFEGDLYMSLDIKLVDRGGLSLILFQAAGMQGEDFLEDYFLRTNGSMVTVFGEDVRNYSWEYYRDMVDIRNDKATYFLSKNPWYKPLDAQVEDRIWETDKWYHIEFLQENNKLKCVINNKIVSQGVDNGLNGQGPILHNGHIAIRFMMRTNMLIKNLHVMNRKLFKTSQIKDN